MRTVNLGTSALATAVTSFAPSLAMPASSYSRPTMKPGDVLEEHERDPALAGELDEVGALERRLAEQDPVVGDDPDRVALDVGEAGDERLAVERLELVEAAAVDEAGDDLADRRPVGAGRPRRRRTAPRRVDRRRLGRRADPTAASGGLRLRFATIDRPRASACSSSSASWSATPELAGVDLGAAQVLGGHVLAGRGLHERRAAEEDRAGALDDDGLVAHRRDVGAAGRAAAHDQRDLRDARRRHPGLVVEDPAEVVAVREDVGLERQERAAAVDEVDARQPVLERDLLGPQVLLDGHRVVGAALDRRVVGDDDAGRALHAADAGDDPGARGVVVVQAVGGQRAQLEERRARVEESVDALADRAACRARGGARSSGRRRRRRGRRPPPGARASSSTRAAIASWFARVSAAAGSSRLRRTGMPG